MIVEAISSILDWRFRNATIENPALSLQDPRTWDEMLAGTESDAGVRVTHATALSIGAVWQAVATISGDVACATLNIFNEEADGDILIDWEHDCQSLLSVQPNDEMCAFELWRRAMVHACLWQNGYIFILREGRASKGRTLALLNLLPDRTKPARHEDGTLYYVSEIDGELEPFRADEIIHIKGLSVDGGKGVDLVEKAKNAFGLALAAEGFGSRFFKNGTQSGGILEIPATFTEKAKQVLEEGFQRKYAGKDNWFKTVILRDGAKFNATTIDAQKSQMHELREDQVRDVARFFNLPPSKLGLSDSVSYNSLEQSQIGYITGCLNHWFCAIRGECNIKVLSLNERKSGMWFCRHDVTELLKSDSKTHNDVLAIQRQNEVISANEWRLDIGRNRRPGGDDYQNPNTKSGAQPGKTEPPAKASTPDDPQDEPGSDPGDSPSALKELFEATIDRITRRVCFDARNTAKNSSKFAAWIDGKAFEHRTVFSDSVLLVLRVHNEKTAKANAVALDGQFFSILIDALSALLSPPFSAKDLAANVDKACADFESTITAKLTNLVFAKE